MPGNQKILFHSILCAMIVHGDELISLNTILTVFLRILIQASFSQWGSGHVADSGVIMILPFVFFFKSAAVRVVLFSGAASYESLSAHSMIWKRRTFERKTFRGISFLVCPHSSIEPIRCSVVRGHHEITAEVITQEFKLLSATKFHTNVFKDLKKKKKKGEVMKFKIQNVKGQFDCDIIRSGRRTPLSLPPNAFLFITHQPQQFVTSGDTNPLCCQVDRACDASAFCISCLSVHHMNDCTLIQQNGHWFNQESDNQ